MVLSCTRLRLFSILCIVDSTATGSPGGPTRLRSSLLENPRSGSWLGVSVGSGGCRGHHAATWSFALGVTSSLAFRSPLKEEGYNIVGGMVKSSVYG